MPAAMEHRDRSLMKGRDEAHIRQLADIGGGIDGRPPFARGNAWHVSEHWSWPLCKAHGNHAAATGIETALKGGQVESDGYFVQIRDGLMQ